MRNDNVHAAAAGGIVDNEVDMGIAAPRDAASPPSLSQRSHHGADSNVYIAYIVVGL